MKTLPEEWSWPAGFPSGLRPGPRPQPGQVGTSAPRWGSLPYNITRLPYGQLGSRRPAFTRPPSMADRPAPRTPGAVVPLRCAELRAAGAPVLPGAGAVLQRIVISAIPNYAPAVPVAAGGPRRRTEAPRVSTTPAFRRRWGTHEPNPSPTSAAVSRAAPPTRWGRAWPARPPRDRPWIAALEPGLVDSFGGVSGPGNACPHGEASR